MRPYAILYGHSASPLRRAAVDRLSRLMLDYTGNYPIVLPGEGTEEERFSCVIIGTKDDNPRLSAESVADTPESYTIRVTEDTVYITGSDERGVLWGCVDFGAKYLIRHEFTDESGRYVRNLFTEGWIPDTISETPALSVRGLWTWGHVIYDWRGYIDHMVDLKLNSVIVWNDHPPYNAREMVEYAHASGIRVIWGYAWFWDTRCDLIDMDTVMAHAGDAFAQYERDYRELGGDGIYFQSFTELSQERIGGTLIADAVTNFVNAAAAPFFSAYPELELQFGLHATSVEKRLAYIARTDPRIRIVWEDCGAFPFDYIPKNVEHLPETKAFVTRTTTLRGESEKYGAVLKGLTKLDWSAFTHPAGPMDIGAASTAWRENRIRRKAKIWRYVQAYWLTNAEAARDVIEQITRETAGRGELHALVEDGMFEGQLPFPVSLLSEILWNPHRPTPEVVREVALRADVDFL